MADIQIDRLKIDRNEALRYLRLPSNAELPQNLQNLLDRAEEMVLQSAKPRFVWREFAIETDPDLEEILLLGTSVQLQGRDIKKLLKNCQSCLLLAATVGLDVDRQITACEPTDMGLAVMLDAFAGAAVENVCDQVEKALTREYSAKSLYLTKRFSPGYGDLPLSLQKPLCEVLNTARLIGLNVSASGILLPRKSVTAIIGLSDTPQKASPHCEHCDTCNMKNTCPYNIDNNHIDNNHA